ncbi:hypothetical protein F5Y10DRAFT_294336 [Nemania abortiva]|nr:hypothetical protein F5Y10DRAFT_294336 [Nemania abortiva]
MSRMASARSPLASLTAPGFTMERKPSRDALDIDDSTQYSEFYEDEDLLQLGGSYPVSENSKEARELASSFDDILEYLRVGNIQWESVECVDRFSAARGIRTTVLIGFAKMPSFERQRRIKEDLESVLPTLPVELVEGGIVEE